VSSIDKADISITVPRTHTDRRDGENGRCSASNHRTKRSVSSQLTHSSTDTFIHADIKCQPQSTARFGAMPSTSGTMRRVSNTRRDVFCIANVTMPLRDHRDLVLILRVGKCDCGFVSIGHGSSSILPARPHCRDLVTGAKVRAGRSFADSGQGVAGMGRSAGPGF
jgi:hypothetical protein